MESAIEQTRNIFIEQIKSLEHDIEQSSMRVARTEGMYFTNVVDWICNPYLLFGVFRRVREEI